MSTIATLIPAYNAVSFITSALDSIARQTRLPDEVIVVDDGSTDDTAAAVKEWASAHPAIELRLIPQANAGASAARNAALRAARAELVAFLDADDLLEPEHHAALAAGLVADRSVVTVFGDQSVFTDRGEHCASFLSGKPHETLPNELRADGFCLIQRGLWGALINGNFVPTSASMTYRKVALDVGCFDTGLMTSEDRDFWLRVSRRGTFAYLPQRLVRKREHASNLSGDANRGTVARQAFDVVMKQIRNADKLQLDETERGATDLAVKNAVQNLLYSSSQDGLGTYLGARKHVRDCAPELLHADMKGWLRAIGARTFEVGHGR